MQMLMSPAWTMALWQERHSAFLQSARLCRRQRLDQRHGRVRAPRDGRRLHLGGGRQISRPLERHADRQGHHASAGCREGGVARRRRHVRVESRRPPDRGAAGADRRAAGDRQAGRQARHRDDAIPASAAAPTWCAPMRSAPPRPLPARRFCGALARSARRAPATSSIFSSRRPRPRSANWAR